MTKILKIFPTVVYIEEDLLNDKEIEEAIKFCKEIKKKVPSKKIWVGDLYNTLLTHDVVKDDRFVKIINKVTHHVNLFNKEHLSDYDYQPKSGWINMYEKTSDYQESHIHTHSTYSAVLFLKSNNNSSSLFFESRKHNYIAYLIAQEILQKVSFY